ncbi:MAG TPA: YceI family protein [Dokdonella sp.]
MSLLRVHRRDDGGAAVAAALAGFAFVAGMLLPTPTRASFAEDAGSETVRLDGERSQLGFTVRVLWLVGVSGRFGKVDGTVHVDRFRNQISVDARIDVDAVKMDNKRYEDWVKSSEFFDVAAHPTIEFKSEPFPQPRLRKGGDLSGMLTLRGIRQPVTFQLQPAACERPAYECPIEVAGTIRRSEFDMHSRRGTLSDKVELQFSVYAIAPGAPKDP